ncbi:unnamed protein product [Schistosoma margrebowiei]|uniref:Uncharacterized protein n=1 Tax=Schistosoma margrebowiei TaxID=48269 RepID=A0A183N6F9_9TREM|nr:unnamed protein product [Schistosoma margrebowiei]
MVVGGSRQETLDPGFVLLGTCQQGVPVNLRDRIRQGEPVPSRLQSMKTSTSEGKHGIQEIARNQLEVSF